MSKSAVVIEFGEFLRAHRKLWLAPLVIVLVLAGLLLVTAQGSALAPFIYTLF